MSATVLVLVVGATSIAVRDAATGAVIATVGVDAGLTPAELQRALASIMSALPPVRWATRQVIVAMAKPFAQYKRVDGLANALSRGDALRALEAGASRFFVHGGARFVVAGVHLRDGEWWGAALDGDAMRATAGALERAKITLRGFVPEAALGITAAVDDLLLDPSAAARERRRGRLRRIALSVSAAVASLFALLAPGIRGSLERRAAVARISAMTAAGLEFRADSLHEVRAHVAESTDLLGAGFVVGPTLAELSTRLPAGSAIVSLRVDAHALDLVVLAPVAIEAVTAFGELPGFDDARVVGAVTRETLEGHAVQRVAVHLARRRRAALAESAVAVVP